MLLNHLFSSFCALIHSLHTCTVYYWNFTDLKAKPSSTVLYGGHIVYAGVRLALGSLTFHLECEGYVI